MTASAAARPWPPRPQPPMSEAINVIVRVRPLNKRERDAGGQTRISQHVRPNVGEWVVGTVK